MFKKSFVILLLLNLLLLTACKDTHITNIYQECNNTSQENNSSTQNNNSFEETKAEKSLQGIALYNANLKQVKGSREYHIEKYDELTTAFSPLYFDFNLSQFSLRNSEQEILVNGQRDSFANIEYQVNTAGRLMATVNKHDLYSLELISEEPINASWMKEYRSSINIKGKAYEIQSKYLANFFLINKLLTSEVFDNLSDFSNAYQKKVFIGDYFRGLVFAPNNKLQEYKNEKYSDAGSYEIKTVDGIEILMIYPDDSDYYYAKDSCYVLNFSRIWQSKCHLKESTSNSTFYDKDVYNDLLLYLKEKFISINVSI